MKEGRVTLVVATYGTVLSVVHFRAQSTPGGLLENIMANRDHVPVRLSSINKRGGKYCIRYEFPYLFILRIISFYRAPSNEPTLRGILIFSGLNERGGGGWGMFWVAVPCDLSDCVQGYLGAICIGQ